MSEYYTHLLIPASKTFVPSTVTIQRFFEQLVHLEIIGKDYQLLFSNIKKTTPRFWKLQSLFSNKIQTQAPSRRPLNPRKLSTLSQITDIQEQEYNLTMACASQTANPPLHVGFPDNNGIWQPWQESISCEIHCHSRASLVRLSNYKKGENPNEPSPDPASYIPCFDEDCSEEELDGYFTHPEKEGLILIPQAGCGRFWIEFCCGKWLYPRLVNDGVANLTPAVMNMVHNVFQSPFIEACSWG